MHKPETIQRKQWIDESLLQNGNQPLSIAEMQDEILKLFGEDLSYDQIHYILRDEEFCDDYIRVIGHPDKYQLEPALYLTMIQPK